MRLARGPNAQELATASGTSFASVSLARWCSGPSSRGGKFAVRASPPPPQKFLLLFPPTRPVVVSSSAAQARKWAAVQRLALAQARRNYLVKSQVITAAREGRSVAPAPTARAIRGTTSSRPKSNRDMPSVEMAA